MGNIKYGTVEYFTLEGLGDKLRAYSLDKLDLQYLDRLRMEVDMKIKAIQMEYNDKRRVHNQQE
jgi:hypothetical protein